MIQAHLGITRSRSDLQTAVRGWNAFSVGMIRVRKYLASHKLNKVNRFIMHLLNSPGTPSGHGLVCSRMPFGQPGRCSIPRRSATRYRPLILIRKKHSYMLIRCVSFLKHRTSLIPSTLEDMDEQQGKKGPTTLRPQQQQVDLTRLERISRQRALDHLGLPPFIKTCKVQFMP